MTGLRLLFHNSATDSGQSSAQITNPYGNQFLANQQMLGKRRWWGRSVLQIVKNESPDINGDDMKHTTASGVIDEMLSGARLVNVGAVLDMLAGYCDWRETGGLGDWRCHAPVAVRASWDALCLEARVAVFVTATEAADRSSY